MQKSSKARRAILGVIAAIIVVVVIVFIVRGASGKSSTASVYNINQPAAQTAIQLPIGGITPQRLCTTSGPRASGPWIQVTSPNGGEVYQVGQQITVTWTDCNYSQPVNIVLAAIGQNGAINNSYTVLSNEPNTGTANLALNSANLGTSGYPYGLHYKILVTAASYPNSGPYGESANLFTINAPAAACKLSSLQSSVVSGYKGTVVERGQNATIADMTLTTGDKSGCGNLMGLNISLYPFVPGAIPNNSYTSGYCGNSTTPGAGPDGAQCLSSYASSVQILINNVQVAAYPVPEPQHVPAITGDTAPIPYGNVYAWYIPLNNIPLLPTNDIKISVTSNSYPNPFKNAWGVDVTGIRYDQPLGGGSTYYGMYAPLNIFGNQPLSGTIVPSSSNTNFIFSYPGGPQPE